MTIHHLFHRKLFRLLTLAFLFLTAAHTAQAQWAEALAGTPDTRLWKTVVDPAGNVTVAGEFQGTLTIGTTTLLSRGSLDIFVARRSAAGIWEWVVAAGGTRIDNVLGLALLPNGDVLIAGECSMDLSAGTSSAVFGTNTLTQQLTTGQGYVAKLTAGGQWDWVIGLDALGETMMLGVAIEPASGDVLVSGLYKGNDVTVGPLTLPGISAGVFAGRLSAGGQWRWVEPVSSSGVVFLGGMVSSDGSGGMIVSGITSSPTTFGATALSPVGGSDIFVARLTAGRTWQWAKLIGSIGTEWVGDHTNDAAGNVYLTGSFEGSMQLGPITMTSVGRTDMFVAKLDAQGQWQWAQQVGSRSDDGAYAVCADNAGSVYVGGWFGARNTVGLPLTNVGGRDGVVLRLSASGTQQAAVVFGGTSNLDQVNALAIAPSSGKLFMCGNFNSATLSIDATRTLIGTTVGSFNSNAFVADISTQLLSTSPDAAAPAALSLSPNPAHGALWLTTPAITGTTTTTGTLLDGVGRVVRTFNLTGERTRLDIQGLTPGVYTVRVGAQTRRVVVE